MTQAVSPSFTAFVGHQRLVSGSLAEVALAVMKASKKADAKPLVIFDDANGRSNGLNLRGTERDVVARLPRAPSNLEAPADDCSAAEPRGRGRPKLGVAPRQATLWPPAWDGLLDQA